MRLAVSKARTAARERFQDQHWGCNAQAAGTWLRENTSRQAVELVNQALERRRLSLRGADRAMRLAWTLADLGGKNSPGKSEMMQGISLRTRAS
jgi:magnesium chelatase family protein